MAINRNSKVCGGIILPVDKALKTKYLPHFQIQRVTLLRDILANDPTLVEDFDAALYNMFSPDVTGKSVEEQQEILSKFKESWVEWRERIEAINTKIYKKEPLSKEDEDFLEAVGAQMDIFIQNQDTEDLIKQRLKEAGVSNNLSAVSYKKFKEIPRQYRQEVLTQIVAITIKTIDALNAKYPHFTREEVIRAYTPEKIFSGPVRTQLEKRQTALNALIESGVELPDYDMQGLSIINALLKDENLWNSVVYMAKAMLMDAEKLQIGTKEIEYVEQFDDDDLDNADPDKDVRNAEEEGHERWQLKIDTISSFNSMSKENRSILYKITDGKKGIFGYASTVDVMLLHQKLMELRGESFCTNSVEFLQELAKLANNGVVWAQNLHKILVADPYRRSSFFNVYRKNHLNYVYHRQGKKKNGYGTVYYRNSNKANGAVLMNAYVGGMLDIEPRTEGQQQCIFTSDGVFDKTLKDAFCTAILGSFEVTKADGQREKVPFYNVKTDTLTIALWGHSGNGALDYSAEALAEKKRAFINDINDMLNLHLYPEDVDILMNNEHEFSKFYHNVYAFAVTIQKGGGTVLSVNAILQDSSKRKPLQGLVTAAKHTVTVQERVSPIESAFRYNKSTYVTHTVPCSLGDRLEMLGKYAKMGRQAFREYLERTYLNCSVFATKVGSEYIIYNEWLRQMYEASEEDLQNPSSMVNQFINNLTRGLGTSDKDFKDFTETDNYIFTLNEFIQTMENSNFKFGVTPLFVTGDSNSSRYFTTPYFTQEQIINNMANVVIQEIQRMAMFESMINWCKRNNYKLSDGHAGRTVDEWMKQPEDKRPPILKYRDKFTFLPELNNPELKEELLDKFRNRESDINAFNAYIREKVEGILNAGYNKFIDSLSEKDIAIKASITYLNPSKLASEKSELNTDLGFLKDFYYNTKFGLIQELQLLTIDPGFYKNTEDAQKRFKENIASGDTLDKEALDPSDPTKKIDDNNGKQAVWYFDELICNSEDMSPDFIKALKQAGFDDKTIKDYTHNTLTDGQGYRSFKSYRKILVMRGVWTKEMEAVYQIIDRHRQSYAKGECGERLSIQELREIESYNVVFQPIKPFYYGFENIDGVLIPVQHKYSEYPIIPELLPKGCKLGELGKALEKNNIDMACCTTAVKVGGFGSVSINNCNTADDFSSTFTNGAYTHQLDLDGWRQQSNVPAHMDNSRARGTQFIKHGYMGASTVLTVRNENGETVTLTTDKHYPFLDQFKDEAGKIEFKLTEGNTLDLSEGLTDAAMMQFYGALTSAGYIHSSIKLNNTLGDPIKMSEVLTASRQQDSRGAKDNIGAYDLDENGNFVVSPAEGIMAADNMASLLSKVRKELIKQAMKGGSMVQVSAFGFENVLKVVTGKVKDRNGKIVKDPNTGEDLINIEYATCAGTFAFSVTKIRKDGTRVVEELDYYDYIDPETGKPLGVDGKPLPEDEDVEGIVYDKNGVPVEGKDFYGWNTKLGREFPEAYEVLAYRIPNEKAYSSLNLKYARFFPKACGGVLMVPHMYTTIAGFDFDIDKLYLIKKEVVLEEDFNLDHTSNRNEEIWTTFYEHTEIGKFIFPYLERAKEEYESTHGKTTEKWHYYQFWAEAIQLIEKEEAFKDNPEAYATLKYEDKSAADAFSRFVLMNHNKYLKRKDKYDRTKAVLPNSQAAVNNLIFEFYKARLSDYDTFRERYTPGGPRELKKAKHIMMAIRYASENSETYKQLMQCETLKDLLTLAESFKGFSPSYNITELSTIAHYQTYNALYDKLIGVAANQNINQRYTALLDVLELKEDYAIIFGSICDAKDKDKAGRDVKARIVNGIDTEMLNTEFLSAAVDAVKDALLEYFGMDENNFSMACLLSKIGASPTDIGLLLNQPVVQEALVIMKEGRGTKNWTLACEEALQRLFGTDNYNKSIKSYNKLKNDNDSRKQYLTSDKLVQYLAIHASGNLKNADFINGQFAVAALMGKINAAATELTEEVNVSKTTSINSIQSGYSSLQALVQKVRNFSTKFGSENSCFNVKLPVINGSNPDAPIIDPDLTCTASNADEVLAQASKSPYCMEQIAYSTVLSFMENIISNYFPYESDGFKMITKGLADLTKTGNLTTEIFDFLNKELPGFFIERLTTMFNENTKVSVVNSKGETIPTNITNRVFYRALFPLYYERVLAANAVRVKQNPGNVIDYSKISLIAAISKEAEGYQKNDKHDILKMAIIGGLRNYQKDGLIESWEMMFASEDPILNDLAKHLFLYSYYSNGFSFSTTSFMSLAPLALKTELGGKEDSYVDFFNRMFNIQKATLKNTLVETKGSNTTELSIKDALKAFIMNHLNLYQFTREIRASGREIDPNSIYANIKEALSITGSSFTLDVTTEEKSNLYHSLVDIKYDKSNKPVSWKFLPCIIIDNDIYICDNNITSSTNGQFNVSDDGKITYYKMNKPFSNYDYSTPTLFDENKVSSVSLEDRQLITSLLIIPEDVHRLAPSVPDPANMFDGYRNLEVIDIINDEILVAFKTLIDNFKSKKKGALYWQINSDVLDGLTKWFSTIRDNLDMIVASADIDEQLRIITELLNSESLQNPLLMYIQDFEEALKKGIVVYDLETTSQIGKNEATNIQRAGIAQIAAFVIKDGEIIKEETINDWVIPLEGFEVPRTFDLKDAEGNIVGKVENAIHKPHTQAVSDGTAVKEKVALTRLKNLFLHYGRTLGHNSAAFDKYIVHRRFEALEPIMDKRLYNVVHYDAMSAARLAFEGLDSYAREALNSLFLNNKEYATELENLKKSLGALGVGSHNALNDIAETYCILKYVFPHVKTSKVVLNSEEYEHLILTLKALQLKLIWEKEKKDELNTGSNSNEAMANRAEQSPEAEEQNLCGGE